MQEEADVVEEEEFPSVGRSKFSLVETMTQQHGPARLLWIELHVISLVPPIPNVDRTDVDIYRVRRIEEGNLQFEIGSILAVMKIAGVICIEDWVKARDPQRSSFRSGITFDVDQIDDEARTWSIALHDSLILISIKMTIEMILIWSFTVNDQIQR